MAGSNAVDPLNLLRRTLASRLEIRRLTSDSADASQVTTFQECTHLSFPSRSSTDAGSSSPIILSKTTPTRFKRTPQSSDDQVYDLQSLLLCYLRRDASIAEYAADAVKEGCDLVGVMQRKLVSDYLDGKELGSAVQGYLVPELTVSDGSLRPTAAGDVVDTSVEGTLSAAQPSGSILPDSAGLADGGVAGERPAKKVKYVVNKEDLEAYKKIVSHFEVKQIADRNTVLRNPTLTGKKGDFGSIREMIADRLKASKEELRRGLGNQPSSQVQHAAAPAQQQKRRRELEGRAHSHCCWCGAG